jgi:hypothetical protein
MTRGRNEQSGIDPGKNGRRLTCRVILGEDGGVGSGLFGLMCEQFHAVAVRVGRKGCETLLPQGGIGLQFQLSEHKSRFSLEVVVAEAFGCRDHRLQAS